MNVIISHPDGRSYSVSPETFAERYEADGFTIDHEEGAADFVAEVPRPITRAGARRKNRKTVTPKPDA